MNRRFSSPLTLHRSLSIIVGAFVLAGYGGIALADGSGVGSSEGVRWETLSRSRPATVPEDYVLTVDGWFHPSCMIAVHAGETIRENDAVNDRIAQGSDIVSKDGAVRLHVSPCSYAHYNAQGEVSSPIPSLGGGGVARLSGLDPVWAAGACENIPGAWYTAAHITVPDDPTTGTTPYVGFFPAMVSGNGTSTPALLQPVLSWNLDQTGGYTHDWTIFSYYIDPSYNAYYSDEYTVSPEDILSPYMIILNGHATSQFASYPLTNLTVTTTGTFDWVCGGVMEHSSIGGCTDLPSSSPTTFSNIVIYASGGVYTPSWTNYVNDSTCGTSVSSTSSTVSISY